MSFYRDTVRTARKEHKCELCGAIIQKGEKYHDKAGNEFGDVVCSKECEKCQPVIDEYLNYEHTDRNEGYCADWIQEWWRDYKCDFCKNVLQECDPDECDCDSLAECGGYKNGKCTELEHCDEMTHYCRCEKFEVKE